MAALTLKRLDLANHSVVYTTAGIAAGDKDVMGGACRLYSIFVDAEENTVAAVSYIKFWDLKNPTAGTYVPDYQYKIPIGFKGMIPVSPPDGVVFDNGLSFAVSTAAGTPAGSNPAQDLIVALTVVEGAS